MDRITKKPLTPTQAAKQWKDADAAIAELRPQLEEARAVLIPHMETKKLDVYKGIRLSVSGGNLVLDQAKIREFLGAKLTEFQTRSAARKTLKRTG